MSLESDLACLHRPRRSLRTCATGIPDVVICEASAGPDGDTPAPPDRA
jgi:hypothetical protein